MTNVTQELNFIFNLKLNSYTWLVATILDGTCWRTSLGFESQLHHLVMAQPCSSDSAFLNLPLYLTVRLTIVPSYSINLLVDTEKASVYLANSVSVHH